MFVTDLKLRLNREGLCSNSQHTKIMNGVFNFDMFSAKCECNEKTYSFLAAKHFLVSV